ncbi:ParB/RepB/Spo0J family partition protein [Dialister micraerophilus]|uniref:Chromosome partitioning protein SpoOJ n=1 Tax=Dialister micraerophilus DSM 19965 TaxID=888062 RepID=F2BX00_9FIRM|nr:ParB/RepB/Spo0J family partition protein [Dialister micraerophilus]EGF14267.1 chromosome partitioning protein SpoOJ [Dialister micraerophilus DSM 19965]MDK8253252.1 ParB/RepB/Spo0J family partition protein [Dialister micraerophilus]MDU5301349.1 ParB/RepB/Spo0J family partition protein [Dialister micraerophilus]
MSKEKRLGRGLKALLGEDIDKNIQEIPVNQIDANPNQPRKAFNEETLKKLEQSIKKYGVVQPVIVRKKDNGNYELIAGERRLRAAKNAQLEKIPVVIKEYNNRESAEIALIENLQREDLNPIEEGKAYESIIKKYDLTQEEMSQIAGKSRSYITNTLRLLTFPDAIQKLLQSKKLTTGQARPLLALKTVAEQLKLAKKIVEEGLSARQVEKILGEKTTPKPKKEVQISTYLRAMEEEIITSLGTLVKIKTGRGKNSKKGTITISFKNEDEFTRITKLLKKDGR